MSGIEHKVYDPEDQLENGLIVIEDWRDSRIGDWVKTDDDCIIQVLRKAQKNCMKLQLINALNRLSLYKSLKKFFCLEILLL